jgi:hypothetical protein
VAVEKVDFVLLEVGQGMVDSGVLTHTVPDERAGFVQLGEG